MITVKQAHRIWLKKQQEFEPVLPIRFMAGSAHISQGTTQKYLKKLVEMGLAEEVPTGEEKKRYRMKEVQE